MAAEPTRCALEGCEQLVPAPAPGRPPRRHCSPEHHTRARILAMSDDDAGPTSLRPGPGVRVEPDAPPPARRPVPTPAAPAFSAPDQVLGPVTALPPLARPGSVSAADPTVWADRRRAPWGLLASVTAGVMTATALLWTGPFPAPLTPAGPGATPPVQAGQGEDQWSTQAVVTLASITTQLDEIDQTTKVWNTQIAEQYQGLPTPAPVAAMLARKLVLQQQQAALTRQLSTAQQLSQARDALAALDRQLASINTALGSSAPTTSGPGPDATVVALQNARALAQHSRDAQQAELDRLAAEVHLAQQAPIPDRSDQTAPVTQAVLRLDKHPGRAPSTPPAQPPALAAGGPDGRRSAQQVTTSQPIPPRREPVPTQRSRMGPDGRPSTEIGVPGGRVTGALTHTVDAVQHTATDLLNPGGDNGAGKGRGKAGDTSGRVTGALTHTVGAVEHTATDLLNPGGTGGGGGDRPATSTRSSARSPGGSAAQPSGSTAATSPGSSSHSGSAAAQLRYAAAAVKGTPAEPWVAGALDLARQAQQDSSSSTGSAASTGASGGSGSDRSGSSSGSSTRSSSGSSGGSSTGSTGGSGSGSSGDGSSGGSGSGSSDGSPTGSSSGSGGSGSSAGGWGSSWSSSSS